VNRLNLKKTIIGQMT